MTDVSRRTSVLLSIQRALLGAVTPNMQAVLISWDATNIHFRIVFGGSLSDDDIERTSVIETELISDFPNDNVTGKSEANEVNDGIILPMGNEVCVFSRARTKA